MRYCEAAYYKHEEDLLYRIYISDSLRALGHGYGLDIRFFDILHPTVEESRTSDEIIDEISKGLDKLKGSTT